MVRTHLCHSGVVLQQTCQYSGLRSVHINLRKHQCIASSEISDVLVCVHDGRQSVLRNLTAPGMYLCTSSRPAKGIAHHRNQVINRKTCHVSIIKASNITTDKQ